MQKTYNSGYSLVVTHLTTNPPVRCLNTAERTGSLVVSCPLDTIALDSSVYGKWILTTGSEQLETGSLSIIRPSNSPDALTQLGANKNAMQMQGIQQVLVCQ
jgi:hypothetical protein